MAITPIRAKTPNYCPLEDSIMKLTDVLLSIKINKNLVAKLEDAGITVNFRSHADQKARTEFNAAAAQANGRDGFRLDRKDSAGNVQADSGSVLFSKEGQHFVSPHLACQDMQANLGMNVTDIHVLTREGDHGAGFLRITMSLTGNQIRLSGPTQELVDLILGRTYEHCYGFSNNHDSNRTFNFVKAADPANIPAGTVLRDLRINRDGSCRCLPRN